MKPIKWEELKNKTLEADTLAWFTIKHVQKIGNTTFLITTEGDYLNTNLIGFFNIKTQKEIQAYEKKENERQTPYY